MRTVFADTGYWIAISDPSDKLHEKAVAVARQFRDYRIVTCQMVLAEFLTYFGGRGEQLRQAAALAVRELANDLNVEVIPQSSDQFDAAFALYSSRLDKDWSMTDCSSFVVMDRMSIPEALAHDHNFEQAGFVVLLRTPTTLP